MGQFVTRKMLIYDPKKGSFYDQKYYQWAEQNNGIHDPKK